MTHVATVNVSGTSKVILSWALSGMLQFERIWKRVVLPITVGTGLIAPVTCDMEEDCSTYPTTKKRNVVTQSAQRRMPSMR